MALLKWAVIFAIISIIAAVFGFGGISEGAADIAKVLFYVFVAVTALLVIASVFLYKKVT